MDEKVSLAGPRTWMDSLGTTVSIACAIQCTLFPLLISVIPLLGLGFLAGDGVEKVFIVNVHRFGCRQLQLGISTPPALLHLSVSCFRLGLDIYRAGFG